MSPRLLHLKQLCERSRVIVHSGATALEISAFETSQYITLPLDFAEYLRAFIPDTLDNVIFRPLREIQRIPDYQTPPAGLDEPQHYYIFADYLIDLPVCAIYLGGRKERYGHILSFADDDWWFCAQSFSAWLDLLLEQGGSGFFYSPDDSYHTSISRTKEA